MQFDICDLLMKLTRTSSLFDFFLTSFIYLRWMRRSLLGQEIFSMHARVDWSVSMRYISIHIFNEQHMLTSINMYLCFTLVCVRISVTIRYMRGHYLNVIYASSYRLYLLNNYYNRYTDKHIFYNILNYRLVGRGIKLKKKNTIRLFFMIR